MSAPYKVHLTMEITNADGTRMSLTDHVYENLQYDNLVAIEGAVVGSLLELGKKEAESRKSGNADKKSA